MNEFIVALGLAFAIEGFVYAAFPEQMLRMLETVRSQPPGTLRLGGLVAFAIGVAVVWIARS